uniref:Uncharacterized protein n=1 Tax=Candidatus Kentrum sp. TC TaxID=2126339 RepID=A0A450YMW2_9GAMM|nr:MAG: hypothetical protein BECKTC1821D_GA0114238_101414 [Candidatus Kentron sp. TC]
MGTIKINPISTRRYRVIESWKSGIECGCFRIPLNRSALHARIQTGDSLRGRRFFRNFSETCGGDGTPMDSRTPSAISGSSPFKRKSAHSIHVPIPIKKDQCQENRKQSFGN